ncbi:hypothetical protein T492DRAFT_1150063 [Pavlovales sp. CCMP2436]|nr:hypothetical protein T492DRAFT_1150063 [Pavlovales sp. CCMP2436]
MPTARRREPGVLAGDALALGRASLARGESSRRVLSNPELDCVAPGAALGQSASDSAIRSSRHAPALTLVAQHCPHCLEKRTDEPKLVLPNGQLISRERLRRKGHSLEYRLSRNRSDIAPSSAQHYKLEKSPNLNCDVTPTELSYATAGSDRPARLNPVEVFHRLEAHRKPPLLLPLLPLLPLPRPLPLLPLPLPPPQPLPIGGYRGDAQGGYIGDAPGRLIGGDAAGFGGYAQPSVHRPPSLATLERVAIGFAAVWLPPLPSLVMPQCHSALPLSVKIEHSDTEHLDNGADTGHLDTGTDTGHLDTGVDTGHSDTGADTGHSDTGADTGHSDTGHLDAGADTRADTGQSDTGQSDTEVGTGVDTGNLDTTADPVHVRSGNEGAGVEEEGDEGYELRASQSSRARPRRLNVRTAPFFATKNQISRN